MVYTFTMLYFNYYFTVYSYILFFQTGSHYEAQAGLKLPILLPQPPKYWDYRRALLHPVVLLFIYI
jgi:hypothetical protein